MRGLKKWIVLLMVASVFALAGCGSKASAPANAGGGSAAAKKVRVALIVQQLGDRSFSDGAADGMKRLQTDLGAKVQTKVVEAPEIASFQENAEAFAKDGYDLIIALGFTYTDNINQLAKAYPNTHFLLVDAVANDAPNVRSVTFKEHEGSFLAGALAALKSKTGNIGFIGGQDIPLIHRFQGGYEQGAKYINPNIKVQVAYVGSWADAAKGKELTTVMYNNGADVVYAAAGGSGAGTIEAAKAANKWAIGVDSNQDYLAPANMLGSMVKRVDNAVYAAGADLVNGKWTGGNLVMGLKEEGVGISGLPPVNSEISQKNAGADVLAKIADLRQQIIDGKIVVVDKMQDTSSK